MIKAYTKTDWIDCRVSAYPFLSNDNNSPILLAPDFLFIDLDRSSFNSDEEHKEALKDTQRNIKRQLAGYPTLLWSGNGHHIYQPISVLILEDVKDFTKFEQPSITFLRFAERQLSNNKCDPAHNPSFKSCMIRLPGSLNSKHIAKGIADAEVKIIQKWNGLRPKIPYQFYKDFLALLVKERKQELQTQHRKYQKYNATTTTKLSPIPWIERLLQTPIEDYRKHVVDLILAPYLIIVRSLSYDEAYGINEVWLDKCNAIRRLDFNSKYKIKTTLKNASRNNIPTMGIDRLKQRNPELYMIIVKVSLR